ncbi:MAG: Cna B-type domain-containing protein [Ruminococcus sp.]|nr:Cna B-type domain-containing protein [Ruminococcus sp.]
MKSFQTVIGRMLKDHKQQKRCLAFVLALSMVVGLAVPLSTTKPAISAVEGDVRPLYYEESERGVLASSDGWAGQWPDDDEGAPASAPSNGVDFTGYLTEVKMNGGNPLDGGSADSVKTDFLLSYKFPEGSGIGPDGSHYIYYQIPKDSISIEADYYGSTNGTVDSTTQFRNWYSERPEYQGIDRPNYAGYYTINKETGMMIIKFIDVYLKYIESQNGAFEGNIKFSGNVLRDQTEDGDRTISFGNGTVAKQVTFDDKTVELSKNGQVISDPSEMPKVKWTVNLTNPGGFFDLSNSVLTDVDLSSAENVTITPSGAGTYTAGASSIQLTNSGVQNITVTYVTASTQSDLDDKKDTDKVTFKDNNGNITEKTAEAEVPLDSSQDAVVSKKGTPSYSIDGKTGDDGYIRWEITAYRAYGLSLNGYTVTDDMLSDIKAGSLTVEPSSAAYSLNGNTLTVESDVSSIKLTYDTPRPEGGTGSKTNSVSVTPPDGDTPDDTKQATVNYDESGLVVTDKNGTFDANTNSIVWTVTVKTSGDNKKSLKDYTMTDDRIAGAENFKVVSAKRGGTEVANAAEKTANGFRVTADGINEITVQYTTKLTAEQVAAAAQNATTVDNTVEVKDPDKDEPYTKTGIASVPKLNNSVSKNIVGSKSLSEEGYYGEADKPASRTIDIEWKVNIDNYSLSALGNYTDAIGQGTDSTHKLAGAITSINAGLVKGGSDKVLNVGTDFTVTYKDADGNETADPAQAVSFEINFIDNGGYMGTYPHYEFVYTTTADVTDVANGASTALDNTGTIGPNTGSDTFTYTREMPRTYRLTTGKTWINDDEKTHEALKVSVTLQRKAGANGTWTDVETRELNKDNGFSTDWGELPAHDTDTAKTPFYYRVTETVPENYKANYKFDTGSGISGDGALDIENEYEKLVIKATKRWTLREGDEAKSVKVVLQRRTPGSGDSGWQDVEPFEEQTLSTDGSSYTWRGLDKSYEYRVVEQNVPEGYKVEYSPAVRNSSGEIEVRNKPDVVNITVNKNWYGDGGYESQRPNTVTYKLEQKIGIDGDWGAVTAAGVPGTKEGQSAENWGVSWTGLPAHTAGKEPIFYRVTEVKPDDYTPAYDYELTDGVNDDAAITVTNNYDKIILTADKAWAGDNDYISDRPDTVTLKLQRRRSDQALWQDVPDTAQTHDKEYNNFAQWSWEPQDMYANDEHTVRYSYRVVEDPVPSGYTSTPSAETMLSKNLTVTNTSNKVNVTVSKAFANDDAVKDQRPVSIKVTLQRRTEGSEEWESVGKKTITGSGDSYQNVIWKGLPKEDEAGEPYYYRVVENDVADGYTPIVYSEGNDITEQGTILTSDAGFNLTNDYSLKYTKTAEDRYVSIKTMEPVTIKTDSGNEEVYMFKYTITTSNKCQIIDTLPEGFTLYAPKVGNGNNNLDSNDPYCPSCVTSGGDFMAANNPSQSSSTVYIDSSSNKVRIYFNSDGSSILNYWIYIPVEDMPEITSSGYTFVNRIESTEPGSEVVTSEVTVNDDKNYITKSVNDTQTGMENGHYIAYKLDINPEGKNLSDNGELNVTDTFIISSLGGTAGNGGLANAALQNFQIKDMDTKQNLDASEYSYSIDYSKTTEKVVDISDEVMTEDYIDNNIYHYNISGDLKKGTKVRLTLSGNPGDPLSCNCRSNNSDIIRITYDSNSSSNEVYGSDGKYVIEFEVPADTNKLEIQCPKPICYWPYQEYDYPSSIDFSATSVERTTTPDAVLKLTVPDGRHIQVTYEYALTGNDTSRDIVNGINDEGVFPDGTTLSAGNSATIRTSKRDETATADEVALTLHSSDASVQAGGTPTVEKVNIGNYAFNSYDSIFKIARYDGTKWVYASEFTPPSGNTAGQLKFEDNTLVESDGKMPVGTVNVDFNGKTSINLVSGVYKFVEIKAPAGFKQTGWTGDGSKTLEELKEFTFYFVNSPNSSTVYPEGFDKSTAQFISGGQAMQVPNIAYIDLNVTKTWDGENKQDTESTIELWWSYTRSNTMPANAVKATAENLFIDDPSFVNRKTISAVGTDAGSIRWEKLPNGVNGKAIYYYLKEVSYKVDGVQYDLKADGTFRNADGEEGDYKPLYSGTAMNLGSSLKDSKTVIATKSWSDSSVARETAYRIIGRNSADEAGTEICSGTFTAANGYRVTLSEEDAEKVKQYSIVTVEDDLTGLSNEEQKIIKGYSANTVNGVTEVNVNNSRGLVVNKIWKNTSNEQVDGNSVSFNEVGFKLYGIDSSGKASERPLYKGVLKKDEDWTAAIDPSLLGDYTNFMLEEDVDDKSLDLTSEERRTLRKMYTVSYTKQLNGNIGLMNIINKDSTPELTNLEIKKHWVDTKNDSDRKPIYIKVYRTKEVKPDEMGDTEAEISTLEGATPIAIPTLTERESGTKWYQLDSSNNWEVTIKNIRYQFEDDPDSHYYYYIIEDLGENEGYDTEYDYEGDKDGVYCDIYNRASDKIVIEKQWEGVDSSEIPEIITVDIYRYICYYGYDWDTGEMIAGANGYASVDGLPPDFYTDSGEVNNNYELFRTGVKLKKKDKWKLVLSDVEAKNGTNPYIYIIKESDSNAYSVSYINNCIAPRTDDSGVNNVVTLKNTRKSVDVTINKTWSDGDGHDDNVTMRLYRTTNKDLDIGQPLYDPADTESFDLESAEGGTVPASEAGRNATFSDDGFIYIRFTPTQGGTYSTTQSLPICSNDGTPYYYYIVEEDVNGYVAGYSYVDTNDEINDKIDLTDVYNKGGTAQINVNNFKKESSGVVLPHTGGTGTGAYTFAGGALVGAAALLYVMKRRRRYDAKS